MKHEEDLARKYDKFLKNEEARKDRELIRKAVETFIKSNRRIIEKEKKYCLNIS